MKVIILGAGPAGLATALRLTSFLKAECVLYEIRPGPAAISGAVQIPPNGLRLFEQLGLLERLRGVGFSSSRMQVYSMKGETLVDLDRAEFDKNLAAYGYMRILRFDLVRTLTDVVVEAKIPIHYAKRTKAIEETESSVTLTFEDGSSDTADLVLGCDGIHSAVRSLLVDPQAKPDYTGISNMYGLVPTSALGPVGSTFQPGLQATMTRNGLLAVSPYTASGDHLYWFYSRSLPAPSDHSREGWETKGSQETDEFKQTITDLLSDSSGSWNTQLRSLIAATDRVRFYPIFRMPSSSKWHSKRCLLMGDAAHAMQPHTGQGTSMALEDAFFLSRLLEDGTRPLSQVFEAYEAVRRPRVEEIAKASAERGDQRSESSTVVHRAKELGMGLGFWVYKTANLQKFGVGMDQKAVTYDIMKAEIPQLNTSTGNRHETDTATRGSGQRGRGGRGGRGRGGQ